MGDYNSLALNRHEYEGLSLYLRNYLDSGLPATRGLRSVIRKLDDAELVEGKHRLVHFTGPELRTITKCLADMFDEHPVITLGGGGFRDKPIASRALSSLEDW